MGDDSKQPVAITELRVDLPTPESPMRAIFMNGISAAPVRFIPGLKSVSITRSLRLRVARKRNVEKLNY